MLLRFNYKKHLKKFSTFRNLNIYIEKLIIEVLKSEFDPLVAPVCTVGLTYSSPPTGFWFEAKNVGSVILTENLSFEHFLIAGYSYDEK